MSAKRPPKLRFRKDRAGKWRWRVTANGRVIAAATQGYRHKNDARRAAHLAFFAIHRWFATGEKS